jgi:hypothetical protein
MMGAMLAEMARNSWKHTFDVKDSLLNSLADMGEHHLQLLHHLAQHGIVDVFADVDTDKSVHFRELLDCATCLKTLDTARREFVVLAALEWLAQRGLIERVDARAAGMAYEGDAELNRHNSWEMWHHSITPLGLDLHQMINASVNIE